MLMEQRQRYTFIIHQSKNGVAFNAKLFWSSWWYQMEADILKQAHGSSKDNISVATMGKMSNF